MPGTGILVPEPSTALVAEPPTLLPLPRGTVGVPALVQGALAALDGPGRWLAALRTPCPTCGLGPDGVRDPVVRGVHFCERRAHALRSGLRAALPSDALASREVLAALDAPTLSGLGRLGSAFVGDGSGFRRARWDDVASLVSEAKAPWWIPGPGLPLEAHLAARDVFGAGVEPVGPAARVLAARTGSALAPMPLAALRRAEWVLVGAARGEDPSVRHPLLARWLGQARGPVTAIGAEVRGSGERIPVPADRVGPLLAAVLTGASPAGLPEAEIEHLRRRTALGPGVIVVDADAGDAALAESLATWASEHPPGPGQGWVWLWDVLPVPFEPPTAPPPAPDLAILHGPPPAALAERLRRVPRRLHLVATLDPSVVWPGEVALLPARPPWEQDGVSYVALDRRARFAEPFRGDGPGESRTDLALLGFLADALGARHPDDPLGIRRARAAADGRYAGWERFVRAGDHLHLGGPYLRPGGA